MVQSKYILDGRFNIYRVINVKIHVYVRDIIIFVFPYMHVGTVPTCAYSSC